MHASTINKNSPSSLSKPTTNSCTTAKNAPSYSPVKASPSKKYKLKTSPNSQHPLSGDKTTQENCKSNSSCPTFNSLKNNSKTSHPILIKISTHQRLSFSNNSPESKNTTNNFMKSWTFTSRELCWRWKTSIRRLMRLLLRSEKSSRKQSMRLSQWRKIFLNHGRILSLSHNKASTDRSSMHTSKSFRHINPFPPKVTPRQNCESAGSTLSTQMKLVRP